MTHFRSSVLLGVALVAAGCGGGNSASNNDSDASSAGSGAGGTSTGGSGTGGAATGGSRATGGSATGGATGTTGGSATGGSGNGGSGTVTPLACDGIGNPGVWENITPSQVPRGTGSGVPNVVTNPLSPGELYIATYHKGFFKSTDCGASWTKVDTGRHAADMDSGTAWLFLIDPVTPNVLYADTFLGSNNTLYKTTNGGVDWDPLWTAGDAATKAAGYPELLALDPTDHTHLVANFHQNCNSPYTPVCFGETTDGGASWYVVNGPPELTGWQEDAAPIVVDRNTFLLGAIFTPLYLTRDDGKTWTKVSDSGGLRMLHEGGWYYDGAAFAIQRSQDLNTWTKLDKTPGLVGFGFISDGTTLFASSRYKSNYVKSAVSDGATWTNYAIPGDLISQDDGSYSLAIDSSHHILYSANQSSGIYRMNTAGM